MLACWKGKTMEQGFSCEGISVLHELDLGHHTLFIYTDGSIDLLANNEHTPYFADNALRLDRQETSRLFISLHEQFHSTSL